MKLIILMIALLIVGLLTIQQMVPNAGSPAISVDPNVPHSDQEIPQVPTQPDQVKQFGRDMSDYLQTQADKSAAALDEAQRQ